MSESQEDDKNEAPLTLQHLQSAIESQEKSRRKLSQSEARELCSYVQTLNLQFQGIGSLGMSWLLKNIKELYLNNNILQSTRGLETLKHLRWLDLSFNKIKSLEGLDKLFELEVLTLHENRIEILDKNVFETLKKLQVLTLGNNMIKNTEDVLILRRLPKLGSLTLKNNPCSQNGYPAYVIAHVPNLVYLDYERITNQQREEANEKHRDSLDDVEKENENILKDATALKLKQEEEELHKTAGVYALNDDSLFRALFEGDVEMEAMALQHGVQAIIDRFRQQFKAICIHVFETGLVHADQRQRELTQVNKALEDARNQSDIMARKVAAILDDKMKVLLEKGKEYAKEYESGAVMDDEELYEKRSREVADLRELAEETLDNDLMKLMENEVTLANQVKEVLELAADELGSMVSTFLDNASLYFDEGRGFAYSFYCRLREITTKLVDANVAVKKKLSESTDEVDKSDIKINTSTEEKDDENSATNIFEGSDTLTAALARIHDRHLENINKREIELTNHLNNWLEKTLNNFYRVEWKRHRTRLEEITTLSEEKKKIIAKTIPSDLFE